MRQSDRVGEPSALVTDKARERDRTPRREVPCLAFTDYVGTLRLDEQPDERISNAVLGKLQSVLIGELKKRDLWHSPPHHLGVQGDCREARWSDPSTFQDLLHECFVFVFCDRLGGLKALLEKNDDIEGVVFLNIRNFLFDRHKKHDPIGFRVFCMLRSATRESIAAGWLWVLGGDEKVYNGTVVGFAMGVDPTRAEGVDLSRVVPRWNNDLLPELVTGTSAAAKKQVVEKLSRHMARLADQGVEVFRFKHLIDPLKRDARERWHAVYAQSGGNLARDVDGDEKFEAVRLALPDLGFEEQEAFEKLVACVDEAVCYLQERETTRTFVRRLWVFLKIAVAESPAGDGGPPSRRKLSLLLDIPRARFPDLYAILGRLVQGCQRDLERTGI